MDPIDELAQALARGISRRSALRQFAGGLATALVATVLPWKPPAVASASGLHQSGGNSSGASLPTTGAGTMASVQMDAEGPRVEALQYLLRANGADIDADGFFGPVTDEAVEDFQGKNGLTVNGVVGSETWRALFVPVQITDQGDAVKAVQTLLLMHGNDPGPVDGDFGPVTEEAVKAFQQAKRVNPADGVVRTSTWIALVGN